MLVRGLMLGLLGCDGVPDRDDAESSPVFDVRWCGPDGYAWAVFRADDPDGDCLDAALEAKWHTDPNDPDTDDDGWDDGREVGFAVVAQDCQGAWITCDPQYPSPTDADYDHDGCPDGEDPDWFRVADTDDLSDCLEVALGSDPFDPDTDGDGVGDDAEYRQGSDLFRPDTDEDGLSDAEEARLRTNPMVADTDGDGLSDAREARELFTLPGTADSDAGGLDDAGVRVSVHPVRITARAHRAMETRAPAHWRPAGILARHRTPTVVDGVRSAPGAVATGSRPRARPSGVADRGRAHRRHRPTRLRDRAVSRNGRSAGVRRGSAWRRLRARGVSGP